MKFTLSQLKHFLETDASAREIADALTMLGLELEGLTNPAEALSEFRIAKVASAEQHPNADKLRVCVVETGSGEPVQVVCGAPNARAGMTGVFAPPGSRVPGTGLDLKVGEIRGVASNGMLLSERELGLSDEHEGIIDLPDDAPLGVPYAEWAGLDDPVIDVGVTPNRPDALGVNGIARDLAAKGIGRLRPIDASPVPGTYESPIRVSLGFEDPDDRPCPLFVGRHFRGLTNGPSPDWMQKRLVAVGLRPISALVDITNYMTIAFARPLHVFDADKLTGDVVARLASDGETIEALDGRAYALTPEMTVIADGAGAQGIAGVIGGEETSVSPETTSAFLEAAYFDPVRTAETGRALNVHSDARHRFERGVDPAFTPLGAEIATRLILDVCGGEASNVVIAGQVPDTSRSYRLGGQRVHALTGADVPIDDQARILDALGFETARDGDDLVAGVPSWRPDVQGEADLVEEVIRIHGLEAVPSVPLPRIEVVTSPKVTTAQRRRFAAARALAGRGMNEAVTWSFLPRREAELFGGGDAGLRIDNPISSELTDMRPSLLPGLLAAVRRNRARGQPFGALFEVGQAYLGDEPEEERLRAAGLRFGTSGPRHWASSHRPIDVFDAKADLMAALDAAGAVADKLQVAAEGPDWFHPGRVGSLQMGPKNRLGSFGEIHPRVLASLDLDGPVVAFEADIGAVPLPKSTRTARPALDAPDLPAVTRDFAFVVGRDVAAEAMLRAARAADKRLIEDAQVFDVFEGGSLGEDEKSIAIAVTLQPREKTLTEEEIEAVSGAVIERVAKATGARLRS